MPIARAFDRAGVADALSPMITPITALLLATFLISALVVALAIAHRPVLGSPSAAADRFDFRLPELFCG